MKYPNRPFHCILCAADQCPCEECSQPLGVTGNNKPQSFHITFPELGKLRPKGPLTLTKEKQEVENDIKQLPPTFGWLVLVKGEYETEGCDIFLDAVYCSVHSKVSLIRVNFWCSHFFYRAEVDDCKVSQHLHGILDYESSWNVVGPHIISITIASAWC